MNTPDAQKLACEVAKIVLKDSFRSPLRDVSVNDVLLFGGTLRKETTRDIDLVLMHNRDQLNIFGYATVYDENEGCVAIDPEGTLSEETRATATTILNVLGGPQHFEAFDVEIVINNERIMHYRDRERARRIGDTNFPEFDEAESRAFYEAEYLQLVVAQVTKIVEDIGGNVDALLDLQVIHQDLLDPNNEQSNEHRQLAIDQSRDPKFWHDVLTEGRLYNPETGQFDTTVDEKYPGATELFAIA